jgi:hypothetical protein
VEYLEFLLNNRQNRFISFESEAKKGKNVIATLNAVSQAVLANFHQQMMQAEATLGQPRRASEMSSV